MGRRSLAVTVGEPFEVEFDAPAGTGYAWQLDALPAGLELSRREARPSGAAALGGAASVVFHLRATQQGHVTLTFRLGRSWEAAAVREELVEIEAR